jgi:tRNA pseudouridine13 synthase
MQLPMEFSLPDWPRAAGPTRVSASIRVQNEDFDVEEISRQQPTGEGSHWWLWVEKTGANTDWVATRLAHLAGCKAMDVGYAGMKDRHAVTRQWFSVPVGNAEKFDWSNQDIEGVRVLQVRRSARKIQRGVLDGNRFRLILRDLDGDTGRLEQRLTLVAQQGVPNYFGPQRFGHGGGNVRRGVAWLAAPRRLPRNKRSIYLSAVRSYLFNEVLAERVGRGNWNTLLPGELVMLDGSHSFFASDPDDPELARRCAEFDVHPTGPLPGRPDKEPAGETLQLETEVLGRQEGWQQALSEFGVKAARRSLRLVPKDFSWHISGDTLELIFSLPAGAYATSVLQEMVQIR